MAFIDQQTVYPTQKDLAEAGGEGRIGLENNVSKNYFHQYERNSVSGPDAFKLTDPGSGFDVLLTGDAENGGFCMIRGHRFQMSGTLTLKSAGNDVDVVGAMQANSFNHIYVTINRDVNSEIDRMQITINTSGVEPQAGGNAMKLGIAETDGTDVINIEDTRPASISLPIFLTLHSFESNSTSFINGDDSFVNVPVLGQTTNLAIVLIAGADGLPLNGDHDMTVKVRVEGPGPDGNGLTQESDEFVITTKKSIGSTDIKSQHRIFIDIENEIGRFEGGFLKIRLSAKNNSIGTTGFVGNSKDSTSGGFDHIDKEFDARGLSRVQNWDGRS